MTRNLAVETESDLVTSDLVAEEGEEANPGRRMMIQYTGELDDGMQFDTSIGRAPFRFVLGEGNEKALLRCAVLTGDQTVVS